MIRSFGDKRTQALFDDLFVREFQGIARRAKRKLEALQGDLKGVHSIRINDQFRIVFRWVDGHAFEVRVVDYH